MNLSLFFLFVVALLPLSAQTTGTTKTSDFHLTSGEEGRYKMAEVDYSITPLVGENDVYFNISLPEGMELPEKFSKRVTNNTVSLEFAAKIVNKELFLDSNGDPLTEFKVKVVARNTPQGVVFTTTVDLLVVNVRWYLLVDTRSSNQRQISSFKSIHVDTDEMPALFHVDGSKQDGYILFKIAS